MHKISKKNIPLMFLVVISIFWAFYYQSSNVLNDFGSEKPEWLLLIDGLIVLPILCFLCIDSKKEAAIKAISYSCLIVLLGRLVIPDSSKLIWFYLESIHYLVITIFIALEITTIFTVFIAIRATLSRNIDPDNAILQPIEKVFGKGVISSILSFEARIWTYALFSKKIRTRNFAGKNHFSCHKKDSTQSNQLGFIFIIIFELPIMHMLLHFLWSPFMANITTGITLLGLVFFVAEYKAISIRPVSITMNSIIIRYGVWNPLTIPFSDIHSMQLNTQFIRRSGNVNRFNLSGNPNVEITLNSGKLIYLGIDEPNQFILTLERYLEKS